MVLRIQKFVDLVFLIGRLHIHPITKSWKLYFVEILLEPTEEERVFVTSIAWSVKERCFIVLKCVNSLVWFVVVEQ